MSRYAYLQKARHSNILQTIARHADAIFQEEIVAGGYYREISQSFAAVLPVKAVGVAGDKRIWAQVVSLAF